MIDHIVKTLIEEILIQRYVLIVILCSLVGALTGEIDKELSNGTPMILHKFLLKFFTSFVGAIACGLILIGVTNNYYIAIGASFFAGNIGINKVKVMIYKYFSKKIDG